MVTSTENLAQIKSQEFISHIKQHFLATSPLTYVTNGIQDCAICCVKSCLTFDLTTYYLVDYNLKLDLNQ